MTVFANDNPSEVLIYDGFERPDVVLFVNGLSMTAAHCRRDTADSEIHRLV